MDFRWVDALPEEQRISELAKHLDLVRKQIMEISQTIQREQAEETPDNDVIRRAEEKKHAHEQTLAAGRQLLAELEEELVQFEHEKEKREANTIAEDELTKLTENLTDTFSEKNSERESEHPEHAQLIERINEQHAPALDQRVTAQLPLPEEPLETYQSSPAYEPTGSYEGPRYENSHPYETPELPQEDFRQEYQKSTVEKIVDKYKN